MRMVVLQRPQDIGERLELLRGQCVREMLLDRPHMGRGRAPEDARAVCGQGHLSSAAVRGAIVPSDETPALHPPEVMG